jgi:carbon-monoxide dehydrogenase medium subunit
MKPPVFSYHDPRTVDAALALLGSLPNARVLAGGQSLVPMLNLRLAFPDHLIDINKIKDLSGVREEAGELVIGAMTRQRDLEFNPDVARLMPILIEALAQIGHRQTRNRGTIGGSLCHLDPAAELPCIVTLLDGSLELASVRGTRRVKMEEFAIGSMVTCVEPDEIVTAIRLPIWPAGHGASFQEFARRHGDFAMAACAVLMTLDAQQKITACHIALAGVCETPLRLRAVEQALIGQTGSAALFAALDHGLDDADVLDDIHAPASYRRRLARTLLRRCTQAAFSKAQAQ